MTVIDCYACNGTGLDEGAWDGRCPFCHGRGERDTPDEPADDGDWGEEDHP